MDISALHSQLKTGKLQDFYIFSGTEWLVQNKYIEQICKLSGMSKRYVDSISDIYSKLRHPTKLTQNYVYVMRDDKELINTEKLHTEISNGLLGKNILVLLLTSVDKRTKFYKAYKDTLVEFEPLKPQILTKYIQKEINLSDKNTQKLMEVCEFDYGRCLLEINKIKNHAKATKAEDMPNNVFELLLFDGTIYQPPKDAIFEFIDAILDYKVKTIFDLYEQCKAVGEATMVMLTVLYDNAKAVLQVQSYEGKDVAKGTGLTPWQINNAKRHCNNYTNRELINIMKLCRKCERGIKTGEIEECYAMDYVLSNIL